MRGSTETAGVQPPKGRQGSALFARQAIEYNVLGLSAEGVTFGGAKGTGGGLPCRASLETDAPTDGGRLDLVGLVRVCQATEG